MYATEFRNKFKSSLHDYVFSVSFFLEMAGVPAPAHKDFGDSNTRNQYRYLILQDWTFVQYIRQRLQGFKKFLSEKQNA